MGFADKYISEKDNTEKPDEKKIVISNEAYALGEQLAQLNNLLEKLGRKI